MRRALFALAVLLVAPAAAQTVGDCDDWRANARNIFWSDPTRTFGNGAIRLVALDTVEPALGAFHVMVTFPDAEEMFLDCRLVSGEGNMGFAGLSLSRASAAYDPATGLSVDIPVGVSDGGRHGTANLRVTVNRATGAVTAAMVAP